MKNMVLCLGVLLVMFNGIAFGGGSQEGLYGQEGQGGQEGLDGQELQGQVLQGQELPRLAVVEFDTNINIPKVNQDSVTVRNLVESQMVAAQKYQVITRTDIDRLLENQQIQVSNISSPENIRKLQLQNISYIVTGSVNAMDNDYLITVKLLDVSTGRFGHSADAFMASGSRDLYNGVTQLVRSFTAGMTSRDGQMAQAGSQRPGSGAGGVSAAGIGIEVSTVFAGTLYFQGEEIATLWGNDVYTIPIERPGLYKIRMVFANGGEISRDVTISSRGIVKEAFSYGVGSPGPGGGIVFYDKGSSGDGWRYLEAAPASAEFRAEWGAYEKNVSGTSTGVGTGKRNTQVIVEYLRQIGECGKAAQLCDSFVMNGYDDWFLPSKDEINLMYQNLKRKGLGNFSNTWYWSSSRYDNKYSWVQYFSAGSQDYTIKDGTYSVRCVRAF
jgi:TolB-like protein